MPLRDKMTLFLKTLLPPFANSLYCGFINNLNVKPCRFLFTSHSNLVKEIRITTTNNVTTVEGINKDSDRKASLLPESKEDKDFCCLCPQKLGFDVKYTDVLILGQFVTPEGQILPRSVTGLCGKANSRLEKLVYQARRAHLLPEPVVDIPTDKPQPILRSWRKYNAYYTDYT